MGVGGMDRALCTYRKRMIAAAVLVAVSGVRAGDDTWTAAVNNYFDANASWTDGGRPTDSDTVGFDMAGAYQVWWDGATGNRTTQSVRLTAGSVSLLMLDAPESPYTWAVHDSTNHADVNIDGGTLTLGVSGYVGHLILAVDDSVSVGATGTLNVLMGNRIEAGIGAMDIAGTMTVASGGQVSSLLGGSAGKLAGSAGSVTVDGAGSTWDSSAGFSLGENGAGTLTISNGGVVNTASGMLAANKGSTGTVTVDGNGSLWTSTGRLNVGYSGAGSLTISNGGEVTNTSATIASSASSSGGATVDGVGSTWSNTGDLTVGNSGSGTLVISGGGQVSAYDSYIGKNAGSNGNVTVDGTGSAWSAGILTVGDSGSGTLMVSGGGQVTGHELLIGEKAGADGSVTLDGPGSTYNNDSYVSVGGNGSGTLAITNGGRLHSDSGWIGNWNIASTGSAVVDGVGSEWSNDDELTAGRSGSGTLTIRNGGQASSRRGFIADSADTVGEVTVDGKGSQLNTSQDVIVGGSGTGTLRITNGGMVNTGESIVGAGAVGSGTALVDGAGSTWTNAWRLTVGSGTGALTIDHGGTVSDPEAYVGSAVGSSGSVTVNGAGSTWNNLNKLTVGDAGAGALVISDGGLVSSPLSFVGAGATGSGTVVVDGGGSTWSVSGSGLMIGKDGDGALSIDHGGTVTDSAGYVAYHAGSTGTVTVAGAGSTWINSSGLYIGGDESNVGGTGHVTVSLGAEVDSGQTLKLWPGGTLDLAGGTLRFHSGNPISMNGGALNFYAGTVALDCDVTIGAAPGVLTPASLFGANPSITAGKTLAIGGQATLLTPLVLNGGTFSAGSLVNGSLLQFNSGTFQLTASDLTVGTAGQFGDTLELASGKHVQVTQNAFVQREGLVVVNDGASLDFLSMDNQGEIELAGRNARLNGTVLGNQGVLQGQGRISAALYNLPRGEVRVGPGQRMFFTNAQSSNSGSIVVDRGQLDFLWSLSNYDDGEMHVSGDSSLIFQNGMVSEGAMNFDGGASRVYGFVHNGHLGRVSIGGAGRVTFFDGFRNDGAVVIGKNATASFYGDVDGSGSYSGEGTSEFLATFSPGNSPADVQMTNVVLGPASMLRMEVGGTEPGTEYDRLTVTGTAALGGTLDVTLIDGYVPQLGDQFVLIDGGTLSGSFASTQLPALSNGLEWQTQQTSGGLTLDVVPEPATAAVFAAASATCLMLRRRRVA